MKNKLKLAAVVFAISLSAVSCKKDVPDVELQKAATTVVANNPTASVEVKYGQAHLSGIFDTKEQQDAMIAQLKAVKGVKEVHNMSEVKPPSAIASMADPAVMSKINAAIKDFPSVKVEEINGEPTLTGDVSAIQARKIKESVDALNVGKVNYNYIVK